MSEPKKAIVRELGFGGLMHIPPMNVPHKLLKELANSFKLGKNTLEISYGSFKVTPKTIGLALGLNASGDLFRNKEKKGEEKAAVPWVSNWNREQLVARIRAEIDGHMGIVRMAETKKKLKEMKEKEKKEEKKKKRNQVLPLKMIHQILILTFPLSLSRKKSQRKLQGNNQNREPKRVKNPCQLKKEKTSKKIHTAAKKTQSKKRKHIIENSSSEEENQSYDGMPEVSLATETDPLFEGQTEQSSVNKPSHSIREEKSLDDPAQQQIIVFRPSSKPFDITPEPQKVHESTPTTPPAPSKLQYTSTRSDPAPEATAAALLMMARTASYVPKELPLPTFSLDLTDSSQEETQTQEGCPETTMLIEELDVLVEKIAKSGEKTTPNFPEGKSPPTKKQTVGQIFDKFETPARRNLMSAEMREKCYLWATRIRTFPGDATYEYDAICRLNAQEPLMLTRGHFASLKASSYIEADIVTAMCLILNQQNIKRFQEEIYCFPPNIVNMAIGNHPDGVFLQPKSKKPFNAEIDHFRVEFASRILFHDMNSDKDASIKGSETMRLSKPSAALLSPYCQVDSHDIESDSD
ncbi:uncharacterized protein DS421_18g614940 [Arachis hypogaea]|nr:uncharacterized protein DS421_18g614940 [Arachis hypogaea]